NDLAAPVANGLRLAARVFDSPVPAQVLARLDDGSHRRTYRLLEPLYMLALQSPQTTRPRLPVRLARLAIYLRGHWLRMPLPQLLRHLAVKAWKGARAAPGATPPELNAPP
ncbi:MAG: hypothetical protein Q8L92_06220, partial [Rubrivivax sp.]|nr:hypothetical protein [Rubrivivax sp.]